MDIISVSKKNIIFFIGVLFILLGIIRISQLLFFGVPAHVFWFCNNIILLMGVAILFRNSFWLIAGFVLLFFGQVVWIIAFITYYLFGFVIPGTSAHLIYGSQFINIISILVHFFSLPFGFLAILILNKKEKFAWTGSFLYSVLLFPFVFYFGAGYNLNCFFKPCLDFIPQSPFYSLFIVLFYFLVLVVPLNYFINWIIEKRNINKKDKLNK